MIEVDIQEADATAIIILRDNGIGIPQDMQPCLFL